MKRLQLRALVVTIAAAAFASACSDGTTPLGNRHILDGLVETNSNDTVTTPPPDTNTVQPGPGSFHGIVIGPGVAPDTINTAPRLQNVRLDVYPDLGVDADGHILGDKVASFTSNANGEFQSPTIGGGPYVVTFTPPDGSTYRGSYVTTLIHPGSSTGTWWILLAEK